MEEAAKNEDREAFVIADDTFHNTLYQAASNDRARKILSSINAQWRWIRVGYIGLMGTMSQAIPEHRAILECLLAGDQDGAVSATLRNTFRVKQYLLSILNNLAMPFAETMERRFTTDLPQGVRVR
jgi:DNA-binding GntR family transcriptional regulator